MGERIEHAADPLRSAPCPQLANVQDMSEIGQQMRTRWAAGARAWEKHADLYRRDTMPVSAWMVEAIRPQPGHTVLELAAGPGDTGLLAAELIQPGGTLICSDFVPDMLTVAQRRAEAQGIRNVRFRQIDAQVIDQPAASLDGVLCRWGYMLMPDGEAALRETRRVLRPGGRVALAAWTAGEENQWSSRPVREMVERGLVDPPDPSQPGQFSWAQPGEIAEHLEAAGFVDYEVDAVDFVYRFPSVEGWWRVISEMAGSIRDVVPTLDAETVADILAALRDVAAPWTADDGSLQVPARTWVAAATV
jgi:SAM-dependent methyltransferase